MTGYFASVLFCVLCLVGVWVPARDRWFYFVFLATALYYGLLGPLFWFQWRGGVFTGVYWGDLIWRAASILLVACLIVVVTVCVLTRLIHAEVATCNSYCGRLPPLFWVLLSIGAFASAYVAMISISYGGFDLSNPFILIAYQFSDLMIPVLLFYVAIRGVNKWVVLVLFLFIVYAILVGLRYKIMLLLGPLMVSSLMADFGTRKIAGRSARAGAILGLPVLVMAFAYMTSARSKFEGVSSAQADFNSLEQVLFGLFAESNAIFGVISVLHSVVDSMEPSYIYFRPLLDGLLEFLPKFLFPWRESGAYYEIVATGLLSLEGENSGTTYPFVGEYLLMGGYWGLVLGSALYGVIYLLFARLVESSSAGVASLDRCGSALVAVFFGYYFFSRGYIPQIMKGIVFVIVPYIAISRAYIAGSKK